MMDDWMDRCWINRLHRQEIEWMEGRGRMDGWMDDGQMLDGQIEN